MIPAPYKLKIKVVCFFLFIQVLIYSSSTYDEYYKESTCKCILFSKVFSEKNIIAFLNLN